MARLSLALPEEYDPLLIENDESKKITRIDRGRLRGDAGSAERLDRTAGGTCRI